MRITILLITVLFVFGCTNNKTVEEPDVFIVILGIAQDAGYPQINCQKACCAPVWQGNVAPEKVISLGLVDKPNNKVYLFDATPDFKEQLHILLDYLPQPDLASVGGIFLTHAHIGHYTGLMDLGREALGAKGVPVYAMPRLKAFLEENGPWSQLVQLNNITLHPLKADSTIRLAGNISITPLLVPHRDEYSETVGFKIASANKSALFIPDIDKWQKWDRDIKTEVSKVDYAFLDATFYSDKELPGRDMREIPHPFVPETMELFKESDTKTRGKIVFIHFNHTNPLMRDGEAYKLVTNKGFTVGRAGLTYKMP